MSEHAPDAPTLKALIDEWAKWVRPYLECFGKHVPDTSSAVINGGNTKVARELVQKHLPSCRRQR